MSHDEAERKTEESELQITAVVREADQLFQKVGGSSRHWVRDCFLPLLEKAGLSIVSAALLRERDAEIGELTTALSVRNDEVTGLAGQLAEAMLRQQLAERDRRLEGNKDEAEHYRQEAASVYFANEELRKQLAEVNALLRERDVALQQQAGLIVAGAKRQAELEKELEAARERDAEHKAEVDGLKAEMQSHIDDVNRLIDERDELASLCSRLAPYEGCKCQSCGVTFYEDVMIDDDLWNAVRPDGKPEGAGLLCGRCIGKRLSGQAKAQAQAARVEAQELETKYRRRLWLTHGHMGLYGDDGEMQCGKCVADFKRFPLERLEKIVHDCAIAAIAAKIEQEAKRGN